MDLPVLLAAVLGAGVVAGAMLRAKLRPKPVHPLTQPGSRGPEPRCDAVIHRAWQLRSSRVSPQVWLRRSSTLAACILPILLIPASMLQFGTPGAAKGLPVRLLRPGVAGPRLPHIAPLRVHVRSGGPGRSTLLFVDSRQTGWEQLGPVLDRELARRPPEWPVYVQGDRGLDWRDVVQAIDVIRGKQAQVVLLTAEPAPPGASR